MTEAKIKAKELLDKFIPLTRKWDSENGWMDDIYDARECARIVVEELIDHCAQDEPFSGVVYWLEVQAQIEKL